MFSRIWIANCVLSLFAIFLSIKAYEIWSNGEKMNPGVPAGNKSISYPVKAAAKKGIPPGKDYEVVVQKNLFWPDRLESEPKTPEKTTRAEAKVDGKLLKILEQACKLTNLYGVIVVSDHKEVLIGEVPDSRRKGVGEKGVKRAKVGDTVGWFKVKEISDKSVLLTAGGHEWRVSLFDKDKPKKRTLVKKDDGPIVIVGGSKIESMLTEAKAVEKGATPKPEISKKETLPKTENKKRTIPVPTDRSKTEKR